MAEANYTIFVGEAVKQSPVYRRNRKRAGITEDIVVKSATVVAQLERAR